MQHLQPNTTLQSGKYRIERVLGQGGFGITYSAVQVTLNRRVAIKEFFMKEYCERNADTSHVTLGTASGKELVNRFKEKFLKEAALIAQFDNPHIVRIYDIFEENNTAYYVMEFLEDRWSQFGKNGTPWELSLNIIKQVGDGLSYLHSQNVLHLDVKPSNILFRKDCAVLIDFGISKRYDSQGGQTSTTPVGISKGFAPLEQYNQGVQIFQPATDIYSLGATLYKILTGETPPEASEVMNYGLPTEILRAKHVPEKIISVIQKSMEPRVGQRYQSVSQFFDAIGEVPRRTTWGQESPQKPVETYGFVNSDKKEEEGTIVEPSPAPQPHPKLSESNTTGKFITSLMIVCAIVVAIIMFSANGSNDGSTPSQSSQPNTQIVERMYYETAIGKCQYSGPVDEDGIPNGKGEAFFYDGRYYKGPFVNGNLSGDNALFRYPNGDEFRGSFKDNAFYEGTYTIKVDGSHFKGTYKNGKPSHGIWYDKNGKVLEYVK